MRIAPPSSLSLSRASTACVALLAAGSLVACKGAPKASATEVAPAAPPIHVDTTKVLEDTVPTVLLVTGTLRGNQETDLAANASGRVTKVLVERGQAVKKGDLLFQLDVRAASLSAAEARANAASAVEQAGQAKRDCDRIQALFDSGAISKAEYERTITQCTTTKAGVSAAQARAGLAAQNVGDGFIRAPFAGTVAERSVDVGEYVRPDSKVVTLVELDPLRLQFSVPENDVAALKAGGALSFTVSAFGTRRFEGVVKFIGGAVREATRDVVAEAVVKNGDHALIPGMFASIQLASGEAKAAVAPKNALRQEEGATHAFVVVDQKVEERIVQTGATLSMLPGAGERVAVLRGLKPGDLLVAHPPPDLKNGQAVN